MAELLPLAPILSGIWSLLEAICSAKKHQRDADEGLESIDNQVKHMQKSLKFLNFDHAKGSLKPDLVRHAKDVMQKCCKDITRVGEVVQEYKTNKFKWAICGKTKMEGLGKDLAVSWEHLKDALDIVLFNLAMAGTRGPQGTASQTPRGTRDNPQGTKNYNQSHAKTPHQKDGTRPLRTQALPTPRLNNGKKKAMRRNIQSNSGPKPVVSDTRQPPAKKSAKHKVSGEGPSLVDDTRAAKISKVPGGHKPKPREDAQAKSPAKRKSRPIITSVSGNLPKTNPDKGNLAKSKAPGCKGSKGRVPAAQEGDSTEPNQHSVSMSISTFLTHGAWHSIGRKGTDELFDTF